MTCASECRTLNEGEEIKVVDTRTQRWGCVMLDRTRNWRIKEDYGSNDYGIMG